MSESRFWARFDFTVWSSSRGENRKAFAHCPELNMTAEAPTSGRAWFKVKQEMQDFMEYHLKQGTLEPELLKLGWVVVKSHDSITWLPPKVDRKIVELQAIFGEEGTTDKYWVQYNLTPGEEGETIDRLKLWGPIEEHPKEDDKFLNGTDS